MSKRMIPLLIAAAVVLITAVPAQAECVRCVYPNPYIQFCLWGTFTGWEECYEDEHGFCVMFGSCSLSAAATPLSSEFEVAFVERIDETPAADQTLVAHEMSLAAPPENRQ